jgi:hypothetical protein
MIDLEPPIPTAEELEACAKAQREGVALWIWNDDYFENILLWMEIWAVAKEEMMKKNPWMRQFISFDRPLRQ